METSIVFLIQISITALIVILLLAYLRPFLRRLLVDLCGTDERAQFWTTFSNIILFTLPVLAALGFSPTLSEDALTQIGHQLKANLTNFVFGLVLIGFVLLLFSAGASRTTKRAKQLEGQE